jgi:hypothetical protein
VLVKNPWKILILRVYELSELLRLNARYFWRSWVGFPATFPSTDRNKGDSLWLRFPPELKFPPGCRKHLSRRQTSESAEQHSVQPIKQIDTLVSLSRYCVLLRWRASLSPALPLRRLKESRDQPELICCQGMV